MPRWLIPLIVLSLATLAHAAPRPNILLILADDMGYSDIGCYGSEISTPNIDSLARGGLRFKQFYNTARCCPTRASLLTGLYPHQAGVGHMVENKGHPSYVGHLNDSCATIAEVLAPAGYQTLMVGKWHVGGQRPNWPEDRGFNRSFALVSGGSSYWKLDEGRAFAEDGQAWKEFPAGWYTTDAFSDRAVKWIGEYAGKEKPFFMHLAYTAPHWPLHAHEADIARYRGKYKAIGWDKLRQQRLAKQIEIGLFEKQMAMTPRDAKVPAWDSLDEAKKEMWDQRMAVYAAQIECMDRGIGRVVAKLKETGALENTVIFFLADNGGCAEIIDRGVKGAPPGPVNSFLSYGVGWANASNTPFRTYKHWVHEGGISTPMIVHWPGHTPVGTFTGEVSHLIDVMPTCVELAGATYPKERGGKPITAMEGRSLVPTIEGKSREPHPALFWEHEGNRAVRQGNWKLVAKNNQPWELYDIATDRSELKDLAAQQPAKAKELAALYDDWAKRAKVVPWAELNKKKAP